MSETGSVVNLSCSAFVERARTEPRPVLIPVVMTVPRAGRSPVGCYRALRGRQGFLLESVEGDPRLAQFSFIGTAPRMTVTLYEDRVEFEGESDAVAIASGAGGATPLERLRAVVQRFPMARVERPRFAGGFVGYLTYELASALRRGLPSGPKRAADGPIGRFMLSGDLVAFDHVGGTCALVSTPLLVDGSDPAEAYAGAMERLRAMETLLSGTGDGLSVPPEGDPRERIPTGESSMDRERFESAVGTARDHIVAGDCLQIVVSRRIDLPFDGDPFRLYTVLRSRNPGPYLYLVEDGDRAIVGSSPEMLLRVEDGHVTTVPIAGTRPRGRTAAEDAVLADDLRSDAKERAEHLMLVDLARNDLGRVCRAGTVRVERFMEVERFSHVQHLVSTVTGVLRPGADAFDALAAAFPAGTVSGAPKLRAMEIIEELEPAARGVYAGAVGYFDLTGTADLAIAIRTAVVEGGRASVQVGAGIVAESDPAREWDETGSKALGLLTALGAAEGPA